MIKRHSEIFYGIICGAGMSVWVMLEYALGFHTTSPEIGQYTGYVSFIFPFIIIFVALHDRQIQARTPLTLLDGINTGFRIAFFSSILLTVFFFLYSHVINPDWLELTVEWQRKQLILSGATDDEIGRFMDQNRQMNTPLTQAIMGFISSTGLGVLVTLIEIPIVKFLYKQQ